MSGIVISILSSMLVGILCGIIGKNVGEKKARCKVDDDRCIERRQSCFAIIVSRMDSLEAKIDMYHEMSNKDGG